MCGGAVRSLFNRYLTSNTNQYFSNAGTWLYLVDDGLLKLIQHSTGFIEQIAQMTGNKESAKKCQSVEDACGATRDTIGAFRFIPNYHKLFTGQLFWQTNQFGWRKVKYCERSGKPFQISREERLTDWVQQEKIDEAGSRITVWRNMKNGLESRDGKYIDDPQGTYVTRDWMDIAMDILILIARTLSPIRWLHSLKVLDLGQHAKWMGGVVMGIWSTVATLGFVQSIRDLIDEVDLTAIQKKIWEAFQAIIDLMGLPFEFGVGASIPPLALVGAIINVISAASLLAKEADLLQLIYSTG